MAMRDVEARSAFFKPEKIGDRVVLRVQMYSARGGTDFNGNPVPQITGIVTEYSGMQGFTSGDLVKVSAGQVQLANKLLAAEPAEGDLLLVEYTGDYEATKGKGKEFRVAIDKGGGAVQGDLI